jgi:hypothetical protein
MDQSVFALLDDIETTVDSRQRFQDVPQIPGRSLRQIAESFSEPQQRDNLYIPTAIDDSGLEYDNFGEATL